METPLTFGRLRLDRFSSAGFVNIFFLCGFYEPKARASIATKKAAQVSLRGLLWFE
jgi:hypothetical protein